MSEIDLDKPEKQDDKAVVLPPKAAVVRTRQIAGMKLIVSRMKLFLFAENIDDLQYIVKSQKELKEEVWPPVLFGLLIVAVALGIFGLWGSTAPLDSAAVAPGVVIPSSNRQTVQCYDGGIIDKILVSEGDKVEAGQDLLLLNSSQSEAGFKAVLSGLRTSAALEARLLAEQNKQDHIDFEQFECLKSQDSEVSVIVNGQKQLFRLRRENLQDSINVATQRILQRTEAINGYKRQLATVERQLALESEKLRDVEALYDKGLATKHHLWEARRQHAEYESRMLGLKAEVSKIDQEIEEARIHKIHVQNDFDQRAAEEYKNNHGQLLDLEHKYKHVKELLERMTIKAPITGTVTGLRYHTIGGVISPGASLMDITPLEDDQIIDAYLSPLEVHHLKVGMKVKVMLNPYKQRLVPRIPGEVIYVSADRLVNEHPQMRGMGSQHGPGMDSYFLVKVRIRPEEFAKLNASVKLYPGMPVTVFLVRGSRTLMQYLLDPITDSFYKSMKEQ